MRLQNRTWGEGEIVEREEQIWTCEDKAGHERQNWTFGDKVGHEGQNWTLRTTPSYKEKKELRQIHEEQGEQNSRMKR